MAWRHCRTGFQKCSHYEYYIIFKAVLQAYERENRSFCKEKYRGRMGLRPTGLSACIFFAGGKKGYRFYPLRGTYTQPYEPPSHG
jgi:hypothetical protein